MAKESTRSVRLNLTRSLVLKVDVTDAGFVHAVLMAKTKRGVVSPVASAHESVETSYLTIFKDGDYGLFIGGTLFVITADQFTQIREAFPDMRLSDHRVAAELASAVAA
jgi:hypothetical protein